MGLRLRLQPGNFLVFGAGNDSLFWATLNRGHATVFLENDPGWLDLVQKQGQDLVLYSVRYTCRLEEMRVPEGVPPPPLELPDQVRGQLWATILVDAPQGWGDGPGRLQSIFEASRLVAPGGTIFVHDCDREGERYLVGRYLNGFRCTPLTPKLWIFER